MELRDFLPMSVTTDGRKQLESAKKTVNGRKKQGKKYREALELRRREFTKIGVYGTAAGGLLASTGIALWKALHKDDQMNLQHRDRVVGQDAVPTLERVSPQIIANAVKTLPENIATAQWHHPHEGVSDDNPIDPLLFLAYPHLEAGEHTPMYKWDLTNQLIKTQKHLSEKGVRVFGIEGSDTTRVFDGAALEEFKTEPPKEGWILKDHIAWARETISEFRTEADDEMIAHFIGHYLHDDAILVGSEDPATYREFQTFYFTEYEPVVAKVRRAINALKQLKGGVPNLKRLEGGTWVFVCGPHKIDAASFVVDLRKFIAVMKHSWQESARREEFWANGFKGQSVMAGGSHGVTLPKHTKEAGRSLCVLSPNGETTMNFLHPETEGPYMQYAKKILNIWNMRKE